MSSSQIDSTAFLADLDAIDAWFDHDRAREPEDSPGSVRVRITDLWRHWLEVGCPPQGQWVPDQKRIREIAAIREARWRDSRTDSGI